jgi:hypothetical protein
MSEDGPTISDLAALGPGEDYENPYEDLETTLPDWWEKRIQEFEQHGLRPYRPPRFSDGIFVPPLLARLEWELDVDIQLLGFNPRTGDDWAVYVDETHVMDINRYRDPKGYSIYSMEAQEFVERLRDHVQA